MSDTAKSGAELLPPQPARNSAEIEMMDRKILDGICWQAISEMNKRFYEETNLIDVICTDKSLVICLENLKVLLRLPSSCLDRS
jgi:hypothetical protein